MPFAENQICRFSSSTPMTVRTTHSPLVICCFTVPDTPSYRYRWFQPSRSDIQITSLPSATSSR